MSKITQLLSAKSVAAAKGKQKPYKLSDGDGLWLHVTPAGRRLWRFRFRRPAGAKGAGKDTMQSLGPYPAVTLEVAREKALDARRLLVDGKNPVAEKKAERADQANTFQLVATEWLDKQTLAAITRSKAEWIFGLVNPVIGSRPIADLEPPDVLKALRKIEAKGYHETAHRAKQRIGQVFRYAIATGRAKHDPTWALRGALKVPDVTNHASITEPTRVGELLLAIDGYNGFPTTKAALRLAALTFVRPGELRAAEWSEFKLDDKEPTWRIPKERMKMNEQHVVPLSKQAVKILSEIAPLTGRGQYVFPSIRSAQRPMSNNTVNAALRGLGYDHDQMTGHGFRSTASTLLNEQGYHPDLIELQLAHAERNKVRAAYNKAQRLPERRKMMQAWANYLDGLKAAKPKARA